MNKIMFHRCPGPDSVILTEEGYMEDDGITMKPARLHQIMVALNFDERLGQDLNAAIERVSQSVPDPTNFTA